MQRSVFLFIAVLLVACAGPISTAQPAAPSPGHSIAPALIPSITPSPMPTVAPLPDTSQYVPSLEATIDLGLLNIDRYFASHPIALDAKAGLIYVSVSPSNTVVLNAATWKKVDSLPAGGNVSLDAEGKQIYIGVAGTYSADGRVTSGEIKLFTAPNTVGGSVILSDTSIVPPYVLADSTAGKAYIVRSGIFIAEAQSLEVTGSISGTVAVPDGLVPNYSATDAAIDPLRQRLYVSLNNGIPGSNNGSELAIYDLTSGQSIAGDGERSVNSIAVDAVDGTACVSRIYMDTRSIVKVDGQGRKLRRLDGLAGEVQIDHGRNRVYVYDPWSRPRIVVLDLDLNYLGETRLDGVDGLAFAFDAQRDRLLVLAGDGRLIALHGHGRPPDAQPLTPPATRGAVEWIAPSPNYVRDHQLYAAFATGDYAGGPGLLFQSQTEGASWKFVTGLPLTDSVASLAISPDYASDRTLFVSFGSPYANVSSSGVYRSLDGGLTWQPAAHGLTDLSIKRVIVSPDFAADHTLFADGVRRGLFRSEDGGATWTPLADRYLSMANAHDYPGLYTLGVSPQFAQDHSLLISCMNGSGTLLSRNRGEAWTRVIATSVSRLAYASGSTIFAVTLDGVIRSDDGGESWAGAGIDLSPAYDITGLVPSSNYTADHTVFVLATAYAQPARLYRTQDGGQSWRPIGAGTPSDALTSIELAPDGALFIGLRDGRVVKYHPTEQ